MITVAVDLGPRSYDVLVGWGARHRLTELLPAGVRRAAVVTQAAVGVEVDPGVEHRVWTIGEGETTKSLETVEAILIRKALARANGNVSHAADALGLSRGALYRRIEKYGL